MSPEIKPQSKLTKNQEIGTPANREKFRQLGIHRWEDLLLFFPLRYEDETKIWRLRDAPERILIQVDVDVIDAKVEFKPRRQLVIFAEDETEELVLRFFHFYPNQQRMLSSGARLRVVGEIKRNRSGRREMVHPRFKLRSDTDQLPTTLTPIYSTTKGLTQPVIRKAVDQAVRLVGTIETIPEDHLSDMGLLQLSDVVRNLHFPPAHIDIAELSDPTSKTLERVHFDELLAQQLVMRKNYEKRSMHIAPSMGRSKVLISKFLESLEFDLTPSQKKVMGEIEVDLEKRSPMRRLLQGDVGSGKTVLAGIAALQALEAGFQVALMVPTEILSEQHFSKIESWMTGLGIDVVRLTGSISKSEREKAVSDIKAGLAQFVIGTHALFQEHVHFKKLGLVIIDEQHRFGVKQRLALLDKGEGGLMQAHQLMMSATPIPRSLAMSFFGDLDVSSIEELPPGRTPVTTKLVSNSRRDEVFSRIRESCQSGQQAYWVCPLIDESESLQLETALKTFERMSQQFPDLRVGLVHGRLKGAEKATVMDSFSKGDLDLLVATTVIEVGVDVPNATVMVIEHAERMGLSQLHQLRGRVGRGTASSSCILLFDPKLTDLAKERLKIIYESADGFKVAQEDLRLRGPGEVLGARQSGVPMLRYADIERDVSLLNMAKKFAPIFLECYPEQAERHIDLWYGSKEKYTEV